MNNTENLIEAQTPENTVAVLVSVEDTNIAENSYQLLRSKIGDAITAGLEAGKTLVTLNIARANVPGQPEVTATIGYNLWRQNLPATMQQHFNCSHCNNVWETLFNYAFLNDDGTVVHPALEVLLESKDDPVVASIFNNAADPDSFEQYVQSFRSPKGKIYFPVAEIDPSFYKGNIIGKWEHFHAVNDKATLRKYNAEHRPFKDLIYTDNLLGELTRLKFDVDMLEKLFVYLKVELSKSGQGTVSTESTALVNYPEFIRIARTVRQIERNTRLGAVYLWSELQKRKNGWLQHIDGSLIGMVLDAFKELGDNPDNQERILKQIKGRLGNALDNGNYKVKTAEAPLASTKQTFKFLKENGFEQSLERRLIPISEIASKKWEAAQYLPIPGDIESTESVAPKSALERAVEKLTAQKDTELQAKNALTNLFDNAWGAKAMSIAAFVYEELPNISSISILNRGGSMLPVIVTGAAVQSEKHKELFKMPHASTSVHNDAIVLNAARPTSFEQVFIWSILDSDKSQEENEALLKLNAFNPRELEMVVTSIFKVDMENATISKEGVVNFVLNIERVASNFYNVMRVNGTCVLGTMLRGDYFGHSRAIVEMSKQMEMTNGEPGQADRAGGVYLAPGMVLAVTYQDGTKAHITMTSNR